MKFIAIAACCLCLCIADAKPAYAGRAPVRGISEGIPVPLPKTILDELGVPAFDHVLFNLHGIENHVIILEAHRLPYFLFLGPVRPPKFYLPLCDGAVQALSGYAGIHAWVRHDDCVLMLDVACLNGIRDDLSPFVPR